MSMNSCRIRKTVDSNLKINKFHSNLNNQQSLWLSLNLATLKRPLSLAKNFLLKSSREILKDETIAVIGYGVQGPGQSLNLRDNGFNVIVGQRAGKTYDKAVADGWVPGETLFSIEEACAKGTIIMCLLSDAAVISV